MKFAVYGTLRKGEYNFNAFPHNKYLGTTILKGYALYDLGPFPYIIKDASKEVVVDIIENDDEQDCYYMDRMEKGAGYTLEEVDVKLNGITHSCRLYTYQKHRPDSTLIANGNWKERHVDYITQ